MNKGLFSGLAILAAVAGPLSTGSAQSGSAAIEPAFPARGAQATITYTATGGPLAAASPVFIGIGFNGFQNLTQVAMTGPGPSWRHTFTVPANTTSIDVFFRNQAATTFDSNGGTGIDWQFVTAETQTAPLGAFPVPANQGGGYLFRVWSPNSTRVSVVGNFNGFADRRDEARRNTTDGVWTAHVTGASTGQEYKYLLNGATFRKDPRSRRQVNSSGNSVLYDPAAFNWAGDVPFTTNNIRDIIIYEAHVGTLDRGTGSVPSNFNRILGTGRLDYLRDLGVTMIHLMPVFEFPGDFSGGYNPSDPFAIEVAYGGPDGLKSFTRAARQRGIGVMMDVVHNHYGPSDLDMYRFDNPNATTGGGIYFYDAPDDLANASFGPRPDFSEPQVRAYIRDNVDMLIDEYRMSGLRWDFTKAIRGRIDSNFNVTQPIPEGISLLREINGSLAADGSFYSVAEDLAGERFIVDSVDTANGLGFRAQWQVGFHYAVTEELAKPDNELNIGRLADTLNGADFSHINYVESHDEVWETNGKDRTPWRFDSTNGASYIARKKALLAAGLLLTAEGVPLIFQGSEVLELGGANRSWDDTEAIDWSRLTSPNVAAFNSAYRDLIRLRRNVDGTTAGLKGDNTNVFFAGGSVMAYSRSNGGSAPGDIVVVISNFSDTDFATLGFNIGFPQSGTWYEQLNLEDAAYGSDFTDRGVGQTVVTNGAGLHGQPTRGTVLLGPYTTVILSRAQPALPEPTGWELR